MFHGVPPSDYETLLGHARESSATARVRSANLSRRKAALQHHQTAAQNDGLADGENAL